MVCLLIGNENGNQGMRMNNVFTCLNKRWNKNQSGGPHLKLGMIARVPIPMGEEGMGFTFPKVTILPSLKS